jgi:hypothetical protein
MRCMNPRLFYSPLGFFPPFPHKQPFIIIERWFRRSTGEEVACDS